MRSLRKTENTLQCLETKHFHNVRQKLSVRPGSRSNYGSSPLQCFVCFCFINIEQARLLFLMLNHFSTCTQFRSEEGRGDCPIKLHPMPPPVQTIAQAIAHFSLDLWGLGDTTIVSQFLYRQSQPFFLHLFPPFTYLYSFVHRSESPTAALYHHSLQ